MRRYVEIAGALAIVGLVVAALALTRGNGSDPDAAAPVLLTAVADHRQAGVRVPRSFLGFSQEYRIVASETGFLRNDLNPVLVGLYDTLAAPGGGPPVLRIGGGSQDAAWFNPSHRPRPPGIEYDLTPNFFRAIARFLEAADTSAIIGLNLAADDPAVAVGVARAARRLLGADRVLAYEIGNEPESYHARPLHQEDGRTVMTRREGYATADYLEEIDRHVAALRRALGDAPLAVPAECCAEKQGGLDALLRRHGTDLEAVTAHHYALSACDKAPGDPDYPTTPELLAPGIVRAPLPRLARLASAATREGVRLRVTESNSVGCAGAAGVSNTFAAALWAADWLFEAAAAGAASVALHGSSPLYQPFRTGQRDDRYFGVVKPSYFGMLLFAETTPHGARLLGDTASHALGVSGARTKVWATHDEVDGVVRVAAINKSATDGGLVDVTVPGASGAATLERLVAPGLDAVEGITWAGRTFERPTADGRLTGARRTETVRPDGAAYRFELPPASAALLTVKAGAADR